MLTQEELIVDVLASYGRVAGSFLGAAAIGVPVGIAMGSSIAWKAYLRRLWAPCAICL